MQSKQTYPTSDMNCILVRMISMPCNFIRDIMYRYDRIKDKDHNEDHKKQRHIIKTHQFSPILLMRWRLVFASTVNLPFNR